MCLHASGVSTLPAAGTPKCGSGFCSEGWMQGWQGARGTLRWQAQGLKRMPWSGRRSTQTTRREIVKGFGPPGRGALLAGPRHQCNRLSTGIDYAALTSVLFRVHQPSAHPDLKPSRVFCTGTKYGNPSTQCSRQAGKVGARGSTALTAQLKAYPWAYLHSTCLPGVTLSVMVTCCAE